jgi:hypothetical protein
MLDFG